MEKEVVTTQSLDAKTVNKVSKSILISRKWRVVLYIVIVTVFGIKNFITNNTSSTNDNYSETPSQDNVVPASEILIMLLPAVVVVVIFIILYIVKRKATQKQFEKKGRFFRNVTSTINNKFFKTQGEGFENTYYWEEMYKVRETPQFYLIYSEKLRAHVIDKAQLDPWQSEDIKEIFKSLETKIKVSLK